MDAPALQLFRGDEIAAETLPLRGVGWVLRWAAVLGVLSLSAAILAGFAYQLSAERALARAAAAGLREALCERATNRTVDAAVRLQLTGHAELERLTTVTLEHNGRLASGVVRAASGDRLSVALSAPAAAALPRWLRTLLPWHSRSSLEVRTEQRNGQ